MCYVVEEFLDDDTSSQTTDSGNGTRDVALDAVLADHDYAKQMSITNENEFDYNPFVSEVLVDPSSPCNMEAAVSFESTSPSIFFIRNEILSLSKALLFGIGFDPLACDISAPVYPKQPVLAVNPSMHINNICIFYRKLNVFFFQSRQFSCWRAFEKTGFSRASSLWILQTDVSGCCDTQDPHKHHAYRSPK